MQWEFTVADPSGQCWRNVHPDHLTVFDFTPWTRSHPGNSKFRNPIKEFAEAGKSKLVFPSWHAMDRWQANKNRFRAMGRLGDMIPYSAIPEAYRTPAFDLVVGFSARYGSILIALAPPMVRLIRQESLSVVVQTKLRTIRPWEEVRTAVLSRHGLDPSAPRPLERSSHRKRECGHTLLLKPTIN
jgi:hypothetical protein